MGRSETFRRQGLLATAIRWLVLGDARIARVQPSREACQGIALDHAPAPMEESGFAPGYAVTGFDLSSGRERSLVPEEGFEPSHPEGWEILSLLRLPFRHSGSTYILTPIAPPVKLRMGSSSNQALGRLEFRSSQPRANNWAVSFSLPRASSSTGGNGKSSSWLVGMR